MPDPWQFYRALVDGIDPAITVTDAQVNRWAMVRTDHDAAGICAVYDGGPSSPSEAWQVQGRRLRDVAANVFSWDNRLAALGVAAINAYWNDPDRVAGLPGLRRGSGTNFFETAAATLGQRRTAIVGHFPIVDHLEGDIVVLQREACGRDLPDAAAEYVLPGCEVVVITGSAVTNRTLPRLLELCATAQVHIVGPSTPAAPVAYPPCVGELAGSVVVDPDRAWHAVAMGLHLPDSPALERFSVHLHS